MVTKLHYNHISFKNLGCLFMCCTIGLSKFSKLHIRSKENSKDCPLKFEFFGVCHEVGRNSTPLKTCKILLQSPKQSKEKISNIIFHDCLWCVPNSKATSWILGFRYSIFYEASIIRFLRHKVPLNSMVLAMNRSSNLIYDINIMPDLALCSNIS